MDAVHHGQFLGLPAPGEESADAIVLPLPFEQTTSYGVGTWRAPGAILEASCQVEVFDEETLTDFTERPRIHTAAPIEDEGSLERYLHAVSREASARRGKFLLGLGGEHTVTCGLVAGLTDAPEKLTVVQIDAHADLADELDGRRWSHGTAMRRLWETGCRLVQVGIRSLSRAEYELTQAGDRVTTYFAHNLSAAWPELLDHLRRLEGDVYLTFDVDGLDPSVIPSTGTPQPDGLTWSQAMQVVNAVADGLGHRLVGADVVEFVPSLHPPGCDIIVAKLVAKVLAFRFGVGRKQP